MILIPWTNNLESQKVEAEKHPVFSVRILIDLRNKRPKRAKTAGTLEFSQRPLDFFEDARIIFSWYFQRFTWFQKKSNKKSAVGSTEIVMAPIVPIGLQFGRARWLGSQIYDSKHFAYFSFQDIMQI